MCKTGAQLLPKNTPLLALHSCRSRDNHQSVGGGDLHGADICSPRSTAYKHVTSTETYYFLVYLMPWLLFSRSSEPQCCSCCCCRLAGSFMIIIISWLGPRCPRCPRCQKGQAAWSFFDPGKAKCGTASYYWSPYFIICFFPPACMHCSSCSFSSSSVYQHLSIDRVCNNTALLQLWN